MFLCIDLSTTASGDQILEIGSRNTDSAAEAVYPQLARCDPPLYRAGRYLERLGNLLRGPPEAGCLGRVTRCRIHGC